MLPQTKMFFLQQRAAWMLKAPEVSKDWMEMEMRIDKNKNPHNDSYKPKLRNPSEIVADRARQFADEALTQIWGGDYRRWIENDKNHDGYMAIDSLFMQQPDAHRGQD